MPVAAIAMVPAPEYLMNGIAAITATTMHDHTGVCSPGETLDSAPEAGSWLSRAIPKQSRIVAARIDRQQTKIAAETTNRYRVAKPVEKLGSMIAAGPMTNAPITENSTALGAARRGSLVSSASVDAVSKP